MRKSDWLGVNMPPLPHASASTWRELMEWASFVPSYDTVTCVHSWSGMMTVPYQRQHGEKAPCRAPVLSANPSS